MFDAYRDNFKKIKTPSSQSNNHFNLLSKIPLMNPTINSRLEVMQENTMLNLSLLESEPLDHLPIREYFKIGQVFKLCFILLIFSSHTKGFNFPIFIAFLMIYYWYIVLFTLQQLYKCLGI